MGARGPKKYDKGPLIQKSATEELVLYLRYSVNKKVYFLVGSLGVSGTTRKRAESVPMIIGARIHDIMVAHPTPPETGDTSI